MKLTITEKDKTQASNYFDNDHCLLATMLIRRGHKNVVVRGWTASTEAKTFEIANHLDIPEFFYGKDGLKVRKSAIGKKIELVEV